jgi:hypothetical protein
MPIVRTDTTALIDVLDRVLDKGIVIDAWTCVSAAGIDLLTITTRVMVASFDTYLAYATPTARLPAVAARPPGRAAAPHRRPGGG